MQSYVLSKLLKLPFEDGMTERSSARPDMHLCPLSPLRFYLHYQDEKTEMNSPTLNSLELWKPRNQTC
jgi:hypothetical protein